MSFLTRRRHAAPPRETDDSPPTRARMVGLTMDALRADPAWEHAPLAELRQNATRLLALRWWVQHGLVSEGPPSEQAGGDGGQRR